MKRSFNYSKPKYGIKGYHIRDSLLEEGIYKADKIAVHPLHKNEHDSFFDQHVKKTINFPSAKYEIGRDWSKDQRFETNRTKGAFLKKARITSTDE